MSLSIFDISKGISWTQEGEFYLIKKESKYELIIDYLNNASVEDLKNDINRLNTFQTMRDSKNKQKIEDYIMNEIEGFNEREDGYSAYIAGAHDKSASIQYNIKNDVISIIHPNIPTLEKFITQPNELSTLASEMIQILLLKQSLKLRKN